MSARDDYPHMRNASDNFRTAPRPPTYIEEIDRALDELDRLRRWKSEAECVIKEWDHLWEMAGCPGQLGQTKAAGLLAALQGDGIL